MENKLTTYARLCGVTICTIFASVALPVGLIASIGNGLNRFSNEMQNAADNEYFINSLGTLGLGISCAVAAYVAFKMK